MEDLSRQPPSADGPDTPAGPGIDWLERGKHAYFSSTTYVDANYRKTWEDSIRAFHNEHPVGSKYTEASFQKRSRIYRPKTRSAIRKNEAAAAAAFFSNVDTVSITAENEGDPKQRVSAEIHKALLEYRLQADPRKNGIPWFQIVVGGLQDAQTQGVVCASVEWKYREVNGLVVEDRPWVELKPIQNIRIDPGAHWYDPVTTSPYLIELIPMYVCDVHQMIAEGKFKPVEEGDLRLAMTSTPDTTRLARNRNQEDPERVHTPIGDYEKVWVQRHIHRSYGVDYHFYMLGTEKLLTDPVPLDEVCFHGLRPYVIGVAILETHRVFPDSVPQLTEGLQKEANEIANQRLDNVKFVLNKAYRVRRGRNVDVAAMIRNVPGRVVMMDDPEKDVVEENWPDVTASSFQEQDRINADFDSLIGTFDTGSVNTNRKLNETVGGMQLQSQSAGGLTTYMLMTYTETFIERILGHLIKLEAKYETDPVVLALVGEKAKLRQKYGIDQITDDLLDRDLLVKANVAMGASAPEQKLQRFGFASKMLSEIALTAQQTGMNMSEVAKEIYAHAGYRDGARFLISSDPQKQQLMQQVQQLMGMLQQAEQMLKSKAGDTQAKLQQTQLQAQAGLRETVIKERSAQQREGMKIAGKLRETAMKEQGENRRALVQATVALNKPKPEPRAAK